MGAGARGIGLLQWMIICTAFCAIMLGLRYWSARIQKRKAYADDWMIIISFASVVALDGVGFWAIFNGLGKHTNEVNMQEIGIMQKLIVSANVCWLVGTVFNKLSVLWLYRRIFKTPIFLKWTMGVFAFVVIFGISFFTVFMTQCHPVSYLWNPVPGGGCRDMVYQEYASVSVNMAIDLAIFILPLPVLWTLQMTTRKKFYITVMLSFGLITIAVMAWRIQATYMTTHSPDFVFSLAHIGLISALELWLGIIVACMPTIPPVIQAYVGPTFQRLASYYYSRRGSTGDKSEGSNHKVVVSHNVRLENYSLDTFHSSGVGISGLSTEVSSARNGMPMPATLGHALRSKRDVNPYVALDEENNILWKGTENVAAHTRFQDVGSSRVTRGNAFHHKISWQGRNRHGTQV